MEYFQTPQVSEKKAKIQVETTITNHLTSSETVELHTILVDVDANLVAKAKKEVTLVGNKEMKLKQNFIVETPRLWSIENPYLYTLQSKVVQEDKTIDQIDTKVGIRSISFDAQKGFKLNGKQVKLKGGCVHHDCGILGAAAYERAEERKVDLLKESGFNAVRCAHNPPSSAFLDACDRLGMLVIDEAFDSWRESKVLSDYSTHFDLLWQRILVP